MKRYATWIEPYSNDPLTTVYCKMSYEDVIKIQNTKYPYLSNEDAFIDFLVVHWGQEIVEIE